MDKQKMIDVFIKVYDRPHYQWKNFAQVCDYIEGKTDTLDENLLQGKKQYFYYEEWMREELYKENAETAKRILLVLSKVRRDGIMSGPYRILQDTKMLLRIGYTFDTVIENAVTKIKDISVETLYELAGVLLEECPEESIHYTDGLLKEHAGTSGGFMERLINKLKPTPEQTKISREVFLALYMAVELIKKDAKTYNNYLDIIINKTDKQNGLYIIELLFQSYMLSPILKERLQKQLATNTQAAQLVLNHVGDKEMIPFLNSIEAVRWPYYYCMMISLRSDVNRQAIFTKLYAEDKETFMQLFDKLGTSTIPGEYMYVPYLFTIYLLNEGEKPANSEATQRAEQCGKAMAGMIATFAQQYTGSSSTIDTLALLDNSVPVKDAVKARIKYTRNLGWGVSEHIIPGFSLLYEHISLARRFIWLLLEQANSVEQNMENRGYVIGLFLASRKEWLSIDPKESIQTLLDSEADFGVRDVFAAYCWAHTEWRGTYRNLFSTTVTPELIKQHKEEAMELFTSGKMEIEELLVWADLLYGTVKVDDYGPLLALLGNKSKKLRKKAEELMEALETEVRPLLEAGMPKMKGDALAAAKRLIKKWDNDRKYGANFTFTDNQMVMDFCADNYDKDNQKQISWIPEDMLTDVRFADLSEKAPLVVIQYLLSEYLSLEEPYKIKICDKVVDMLHRPDLQSVFENIYLYWKDNGAEAKKKMFMVPYCIYASDTQILALRTQLKDWAEASRGAIAAFVVNAIAMNGGSVALMMIDAMATKFPNNQVKNAAKAAFSFAAKALEIPEDVLSDKIVPTLGFNKEGEKVLDYGSRTFTITLMPDFSLSIRDDEKQKNIKSMPSPGVNDDAVKATAAKKEFSELKKQIKATVQAQTNRLEKVIMNGRRWKADAWSELFVENPIMHKFATGLIWGAYEDSTLLETFRYMDDGTFNTVNEDEYALPDHVAITLIHPCELSDETLAQWKEQLDDYEVVQPLPQLTMSVPELAKEEMDNNNKIVRYKGTMPLSGKIAGLAKKYNMVRGEVWDGGSYTCFHWVDKYLNIAAQLNFEYMYMGQDYDEDVTLNEVVFYRLPEDGTVVEEPAANLILNPNNVPQRFVCSVIGVFDTLKEN
ncbi:DUF4132 domain-containing protein [Bacteroides sp. 224]|uniref:DUF4132 domain-containing protein n=1 Tax=Bacteroides sp. 224 TaxID=2302936 RepID=UPI0013CF692F|nr:DUF4132 domain-containing protein [Bacteroides sp. 224]NDV67179.1 DUF4132 domain-containing protein [Bacteroides sp. 224]